MSAAFSPDPPFTVAEALAVLHQYGSLGYPNKAQVPMVKHAAQVIANAAAAAQDRYLQAWDVARNAVPHDESAILAARATGLLSDYEMRDRLSTALRGVATAS